ncbi:MAG: hypothetical protein CYPHOPRED_005268 [Cyphobasidiales sp. Tagirdzhanova-0007]|nr:MAG: hypothetical protein CYPHOPRED_005268 [Cyphobasidiales sp. Tagirdzhanova-0007]
MARLLWRGSLSSPDLDGLAIVAPSFRLAAINEDDPFSSSHNQECTSQNTAVNAELCLDLEMMRNSTLAVREKRVRLVPLRDGATPNGLHANIPPAKLHGRKALKSSIEMLRKGKTQPLFTPKVNDHQDGSRDSVAYLELPTIYDHALSLYIDKRCPETVAWFNEIFCKEPVDSSTRLTGTGVLLSLNPESKLINGNDSHAANASIVVYGRLVDQGPFETSERPIVQLHVARPRNPKELEPKPGDPAPRENLFAQQLRRTVSQPALTLSTSAVKASSRSTKEAKTSTKANTRVLQRSQTTSLNVPSKARNLFGKTSTQATSSGKQRTLSSSSVFLAQKATSHANASPGRRGHKRPKLTAGGLRMLQKADDPEKDPSNATPEETNLTRAFEQTREGSPTPSIATNRSTNRHAQGTFAGASTQRTGPLNRSVSMPPGRTTFGTRSAAIGKRREGSAAPSIGNTEVDPNEGGMEMRNKGTIRKVLLAEMIARKMGREQPEFKDIFSVAYRGILCAFRHTLYAQKFDKIEIIICARKHLEMYISNTTQAAISISAQSRLDEDEEMLEME